MSRAEWRLRDMGDYALDFDGETDEGVVPHSTDFELDSITVSIWMRLDSVIADYGGIFDKRYNSSWAILQDTGDPEVNWYVTNEAGDANSLRNISTPVGDVVHIVGTYDGSSGVHRVYKNATEVRDGSIPASPLRKNTSDVLFAGSHTHSHSDSTLDNGRVYNRALSPTEISNLHNGEDIREGLIGHWPFDNGSGSTVSDESGNENDGTLNGDPQWVDPSNNPNAIESGLIDARLRKTYNRFSRNAEAALFDPDGNKVPNYPKFKRVSLEIKPPDGTFSEEFGGFVTNPKTDDNRLNLDILSHDLWLKKRNPFVNYSNTSISTILNDLITTYTPLDWVAGNVTVTNDISITDEWKGESLDSIIADLAEASGGEIFGANNAGEFFFRPAETEASPRDFTEGQYYDADFEEDAAAEVNRVVVYYTADSSQAVAHQDRPNQKALADELGFSSPVVIEVQRDHPEIPNEPAAERKAEAILNNKSAIRTGTLETWRGYGIEPGDVTKVVVPDQDVDGQYRVAAIEFALRDNTTSIDLAENKEGVTDVLVSLSGETVRVDLKGADSGATVNEFVQLPQDVLVETELEVYTRSVPDTQFMFGDWKGALGDPDIGGGRLGDQRGDLELHDSVTG